MSHYVQPAIRRKPEQVINSSCGTNNLANNALERIVADIKSLANNGHENIYLVAKYTILPRKGPLKKVYQVNEKLKEFCSEKNFYFNPQKNINPTIHTNRTGLHLNSTGLGNIINNFKNFLEYG